MSLSDDVISEVIKDGVKITTYKDGSQHFETIEKDKPAIEIDNRSWWQKIKDWWNNSNVKPYVKIRDLADPFGDRDDPDKGSDGATGAEIGIKISF